MNKFYFVLLFACSFACRGKEQEKTVATPEVAADPYLPVYGNWVGSFIASDEEILSDDFNTDMNKINIRLKRIENDSVFGESIVAGNIRPLKGTVRRDNEVLLFSLSEPGDHKYDGVFEFGIHRDTLSGTWVAFKKDIKVTERKYALRKQAFAYNKKLMLPDSLEYIDYAGAKTDTAYESNGDGIDTLMESVFRVASDQIFQLNGSTEKLTEKKLKNLKKIDLEIIRNTIYARHGYTFKKKSYRQFFNYVDWYIPFSTNVEKELTPIEKENIVLLNRFEKYAQDNYDSFGR